VFHKWADYSAPPRPVRGEKSSVDKVISRTATAGARRASEKIAMTAGERIRGFVLDKFRRCVDE